MTRGRRWVRPLSSGFWHWCFQSSAAISSPPSLLLLFVGFSFLVVSAFDPFFFLCSSFWLCLASTREMLDAVVLVLFGFAGRDRIFKFSFPAPQHAICCMRLCFSNMHDHTVDFAVPMKFTRSTAAARVVHRSLYLILWKLTYCCWSSISAYCTGY